MKYFVFLLFIACSFPPDPNPIADCNEMRGWLDEKGMSCFNDWGETPEISDEIPCDEVVGITDRDALYDECRVVIRDMGCFDFAFIAWNVPRSCLQMEY